MTGGELLIEALRRAGVRWIYGIPGGQTLSLLDPVVHSNDIRFVTTRHECAAACMADAFGRLTGGVGVCVATTGPGMTNLLTGIGGAYKDSSPVLVLAINNELRHLGRDDAQAADHVAIFKTLTKAANVLLHPDDLIPKLRWALASATSGCPGPVLLDIPRDVLEGRADVAALETFAAPAPVRPALAPDAADRIARRLCEAARPVIWCGNGVKLSRAGAAWLAVAERLDVPYVTTYNGMGGLPTTHRLSFGVASRMGTGLAIQALADSDCLLVVGNSLNAVSTGRWTMKLPQDMLQIDIESEALGRQYSVKMGSVADAGMAASAIDGAIAKRDEATAKDRHAAWFRRLDASRTTWRRRVAQDEVAGAPVRPQLLMRQLGETLPRNTALIVDAGNPGLWSFLLPLHAETTYMKPVGFGNMGFALPGAIAVKMEQPGRPVVCLIGDGSLGMTLAEIETAVRERVPVAVVVMNDAGYGNIRQEQAQRYPDRVIGVDFNDVDYGAVARALGAAGERITSSADVPAALGRALHSDGPYLVDVPIAADNVRTYPPFSPIEQTE